MSEDFYNAALNSHDNSNQVVHYEKETSFKDIYIVFDSKYRNTHNRLRYNGMQFNIINLVDRSTAGNGQVKVSNGFSNIIEMELNGDFYYPQQSYGYSASNAGIYYHKEIVMAISRLSTHGYTDSSDNAYQFRLRIHDTTAKPMLLKPVSNCTSNANKVIFRNNVTFDDVDINFRLPVEKWTPDDDIYNVTITYANPVTLTVNTSVNGSGDSGHGFTSAVDAISFINFTSGLSAFNSQNQDSVVYTERVYVVTQTGATTFTVPIDMSGDIASDAGKPTTVNVYVESRRMRIPIRFRAINGQTTNCLTAIM